MKTIAIASGKGGAGKTSVMAALARYLGTSAVACDCDVDAANTAIALGTSVVSEEEYWSGDGYSIETGRCVSCGACAAVCRFGAIEASGKSFRIDETSCERCASCLDACPAGAVIATRKKGGSLFVSSSDDGAVLVHAELVPGEDTSGKLVRAVRQRAEKEAQDSARFVVVDSPPGIGCPVIASLSGADLALVVVEAGKSGIRDARRLFELLAGMNRRTVSVINKTGIDLSMDSEAKALAREFGSMIAAEIPFHERFRKSTELGEAWVDAEDGETRILSRLMCGKIMDQVQLINIREGEKA